MAKILFHPDGEDNWISDKQNNGDFDYWLRLKLYDMERESVEEGTPRWIAQVTAIAPGLLTKEKLAEVAESACVDIEEVNLRDIGDHGFCAYLYEESSGSKRRLLEKAKKEAQTISLLFGFYMDKPQNHWGLSGWDYISGNITVELNQDD